MYSLFFILHYIIHCSWLRQKSRAWSVRCASFSSRLLWAFFECKSAASTLQSNCPDVPQWWVWSSSESRRAPSLLSRCFPSMLVYFVKKPAWMIFLCCEAWLGRIHLCVCDHHRQPCDTDVEAWAQLRSNCVKMVPGPSSWVARIWWRTCRWFVVGGWCSTNMSLGIDWIACPHVQTFPTARTLSLSLFLLFWRYWVCRTLVLMVRRCWHQTASSDLISTNYVI